MTSEAVRYIHRGAINYTLEFIREMVQYCIAASCLNPRGDGVSLFKFPVDPLARKVDKGGEKDAG